MRLDRGLLAIRSYRYTSFPYVIGPTKAERVRWAKRNRILVNFEQLTLRAIMVSGAVIMLWVASYWLWHDYGRPFWRNELRPAWNRWQMREMPKPSVRIPASPKKSVNVLTTES